MCLECLTTSDLLIAVGTLATFFSVLVALFPGVGGAGISRDMTLPEDLSDDLVFILDCLERKSESLLERLNKLAA